MIAKNGISDPKNFGPGIWHLIHSRAKDATTPEKKKEFKEFMAWTCSNLPCLQCRDHCQKYMTDHPMDFYINLQNDKGEQYGLFKWTWIMHNNVNNRLGKPQTDWSTAYGMYYGTSGVCSASCAEPDKIKT